MTGREKSCLATYTERQQEAALRDEIVRVCRLVWEKGFVTASDGNASIRLDHDRILLTPSGLSKGFFSASFRVLAHVSRRASLTTAPVAGSSPKIRMPPSR